MCDLLLVTLMRTGANLTPLLRMSRTGVVDGLLPGSKRLRLSKVRSHKVFEIAIHGPKAEEELVPIPTDAVAILNKALALSEGLTRDALEGEQDRVWLYQTMRTQQFGEVRCLEQNVVRKNFAAFAKRRQVLSDSGGLLEVSAQRVRQTHSARVLRLSGSDVVITSALLGNTPRVSDEHYAGLSTQLRIEAGKVFRHELVERLRGTFVQVVRADELPASADKTPSGRCLDPITGHLAPSDAGAHCMLFTHCFFCKSFAVVGDLEDLWRLFSYQRFAAAELLNIDSVADIEIREQLRAMYELAIQFIDSFTVTSFKSSLVEKAKRKAEAHLHPFWSHEMELSRLNRRQTAGSA